MITVWKYHKWRDMAIGNTNIDILTIRNVIGCPSTNLGMLIAKAKEGGKTGTLSDGSTALLAFNVKENGGTNGVRIEGAVPYLNPFSYDSPVEWKYDSMNRKLYLQIKQIDDKYAFQLGKFAGYNHESPALSIDELSQPVVYIPGNFLNIGGTPNWGDPRYEWNNILGGFTWNDMKIKIEVYDKNKVLRSSSTFRVGDLQTGHWSITVSKLGIVSDDGYLYVKGYFCDYNGNVLAEMPTMYDGFIKKPILFTQFIFCYLRNITSGTAGCTILSPSLSDGNGGMSASGTLYYYNTTQTDYSTGKYYPRMDITITDRDRGLSLKSVQFLDAKYYAPGPGMTRTWTWVNPGFPGFVDNGTFDIDVIASLEYRP